MEHILVIDQGRLVLDEEAEALRGRAFTVVGPAARVDTYTAGKELLARAPLGGLVSATVMGNGDLKDRKLAEALGLSLVPVSLQQLIVHLTSEPSDKKGSGSPMSRIASVMVMHARDRVSWFLIPASILGAGFVICLFIALSIDLLWGGTITGLYRCAGRLLLRDAD